MRLVIGSALVLALAAGCGQRGTTTAPESRASGAAAVTWHPDTTYDYRLRMHSTMGPVGGAPSVDFTLTAGLHLVPYRVSPDQTELHATLTDVVATSASKDQGQYDRLAEELERPFLVTLAHGRLGAIRISPGRSQFAVGIAQATAAALQVSGGAGAGWTATEADATGEYEVQYQTQGGALTRKKLRYLGVAATTNGRSPFDYKPRVLASDGRVQLEQGRLARMESSEELEVSLAAMGATLRSRTTVELSLAGTRSGASADWQALSASAIEVSARKPYREPAKDKGPDMDLARMGNLSFEQALALAEQQVRASGGEAWAEKNGVTASPEQQKAQQEKLKDRSRAFFALVGWFSHEPRTIAHVLPLIRRGDAAGTFLMDALSSAGTEPAQAALVELMSDAHLSGAQRRHAATSLIRTPAASDATIAALKARLDDPEVGPHATYGLGSISRRRREAGDVATSRALAELLMARLDQATTLLGKTDLLRAIANTAYPGALDVVKRRLADNDERVRRVAIETLAFLGRPEADALVAGFLTDSQSGRVRTSALEAARRLGPSDGLVAAVLHVARTTADKHHRLAAIRLLDGWTSSRPELTAELAAVARSETDETIRKVAQASVDAHSRPQ